MGNRKAAYIATVERIDDIENKDKIKYIKLKDLGWQIIHNIESSPLQIGDKIVYIEYDTIITPCEELEFLRKRCWSERYNGFKLSAMKMAGVCSYGLIITFESAQKIINDRINKGFIKQNYDLSSLEDGLDLSEILGIKPIDDCEEYEANKQTQVKLTKWQRFVKKYAYFIFKFLYFKKFTSADFPSFIISKSDETRIEILQKLFNDEYKNIPVYSTIKIDGQSCTAAIYKGNFYIASRNICKYKQPVKKAIKDLIPKHEAAFAKNSNDFLVIACRESLPKKLYDYWKNYNNKKDFALQSELAGPGIQKNLLGLTFLRLYVYNFFDTQNKRYYNWDKIRDFCSKEDLYTVPFIEKTTFHWNNTKELKEYARGAYPNGNPREGVVIRALDPNSEYIPDPPKGCHGCFSFKVINDDYLS